jgi:cystathionine beta-synthase
LRYCREQSAPKRVVTFVCDSGNKYLSKMFNDYWMQDQGLLPTPARGDLRDLISRSHEKGSVVAVSPQDSLAVAQARMKLYDISQLPVLDGSQIVGMLDESDLLVAAARDATAFRRPVREVMCARLTTVAPSAPVESLLPIFDAGMVAIVVDGDRFLGLITRMDVLNYFRRKLA